MSAPTPSADDLAFVRQQTNGAAEFTDEQLSTLMGQWTSTAEDETVTLDLWAAAAMVMEYRLLASMEDPRTGSSQARSGDSQVQYRETGGSTWLLRSYIRRYWRNADPANRALVHPSGWRVVDAETSRRWQILLSPLRGLAINGPGVGVDALPWPR
jgi:hypothetical protein